MKTKENVVAIPRETTTAIAILKFVPLLCLVVMIVGFKLNIMVAASLACVVAGVVVMYVKRCKVGDVIDIMTKSAGDITIVYMILMLAYCVAETFMASGVGASVIIMALDLGITGQTIAPLGIVVTAVLSVATGSSWGTFAACAPIFLWLNYIVGGDLLLTSCAIAGGSCFGDNIGLISDTTVVSSGLNGVNVVDRMRHQGVWSVGCLVISAAIFFVLSMGNSNVIGDPTTAISSIPVEAMEALALERPSAIALLDQVATGVPIYMVIPMIAVIAIALCGVNTMVCLASGMVVAVAFGMMAGTMSIQVFLFELLPTGFAGAGAFSICLIMWIAAFGGLVSSMDAFSPLAKFIVNHSKKVRHLMTWNALLCLFGNAALADEMAEITTTTPITRSVIESNIEGSEEAMYKLRLRNATFSDAMGVYGSQLIPWHCYIVYYVAIANAIYPLHVFTAGDFISKNVMAFVAVGSMLFLTFTGLDRLVPFFAIPSEPEVKLKSR